MVEHLDSNNFKEKTNSGTAVVDFYADWCGPCKRMAPIFEELDGEIDNVNFFKVNVDENSDLAAQYEVRSIPTLVILKDGEQVGELHGLVPKDQIKEKLAQHA